MIIEMYCPRCGLVSVLNFETFSLQPGEVFATCLHCDQKFKILMEFYPQESLAEEPIDAAAFLEEGT